jgi:hypothetical protein
MRPIYPADLFAPTEDPLRAHGSHANAPRRSGFARPGLSRRRHSRDCRLGDVHREIVKRIAA